MTRHARRTDPETSHAASEAVEVGALASHKAKVLAAVRAAGTRGATWKDAERATGVLNCWRRCSDLLDDEAIVATGETRVEAETGREERVYVAAEFADGYEPAQLTLGEAS